MAQVEEIAKENLTLIPSASNQPNKKMVIGTARSMGVDVKGVEYVSSMTEDEKFERKQQRPKPLRKQPKKQPLRPPRIQWPRLSLKPRPNQAMRKEQVWVP